MAEISSRTTWKLAKVLRGKAKRATAKDGVATVSRVGADGTMWVRLPGSGIDTPVNGTRLSEAATGDQVRYHIDGGRLSVTGNASVPAVGGTYVSRTIEPVASRAATALSESQAARAYAEEAEGEAIRAGHAANSAQTSANEAYEAAQQAIGDAADAASAAASAQEDASAASEAAAAAQEDATAAGEAAASAQESADAAGEAAQQAIGDAADAALAASAAQDSADAAASAASVADGKAEEAASAAAAAQGSANTANRAANGALAGLSTLESVIDTVNWFAAHKVATTDTSVQSGKTYYEYDSQTGTLSAVTPEGTENPSTEGWYELDETIQNYVASHVAETDDGLYVVGLSNGWRVLISSGAGDYTAGYFLIDPQGNIAQATTASGFTFDSSKTFYVGDEDAYIVFDGDGGITIGGTGVNISGSVVIGGYNRTLSQVLNDSIVAVEYGVGNSPTSHSDITSWSSSTPAWQSGKYVWERTTTNGMTYTYACIQGAKGDTGASGAAGPKGDTGRGISATSYRYGTSSSASTEPTNWGTSVPSVSQGQWLWVETTHTYSDSTTSKSYTKSYQGTDGEDGTSVFVQSATKSGDTTTVVIADSDGNQSTLTIVDGADGANGTPGANGYVHTAWATSADGSQGFSTTVSANKTYLGVYSDNTAADSQTPGDYSWSLIKGADGANGYNTATITLYQRAASQPSKPSSTLTYTFSTHALSGSLGSWSTSVPSGTDPCWVTAATATSNTATDTIESSEWVTPTKLVEDGTDGLNQATVYLYQRAASSPSKPSGNLTYTFSTGALSGTLGSWTRGVPTTDGNPCWVISAVAIASAATDTIASSDWSSPTKMAEDGTSVTVSKVEYGTSSGASTQPSSWSQTVPTSITKGLWLWVKTTYSDGSTATTKSYVGTDGEDGKSVYVKSSTKVGDTTTVVLTDGTTDTTLTISDGEDGDNGTPGASGYVHTAWANSADGTTDFSTSVSANKSYLGVYTDNTAADSTSPSSYSWSLIKGPQGDQGPKGDTGDPGTAAYAYDLIVSPSVVVRAEDGTLSPTSITLSATRGQGTGTPSAYSGRFKVDRSSNGSSWTNVATSSSNESSKTVSVPTTSGVTLLRCQLYLAGGTTTLLDQQTVPIVSDGPTGDTGPKGDTGSTGSQGPKGDTGAPGKGISSITEYYALNNSTTAPADSSFSTGVKTPTSSNRYVWNYELITYTDNSTSKTDKHIAATYGESGSAGKGISSITDYYVATNSTSTPADSAFSTTMASPTASNRYLWNYEKTTYTDSTTSSSGKRIIGVYGETGDTGPTGATGDPGADAYTVVLTNESHTFPGGTSAAIAGSTTCNVVAYKGGTQVAATIGTITGQVSGLTTSVTSNGTTSAYFTVSVTTSLTTRSGVLTVPVTVDGHSFTKKFSWSLALTGAKGDTGSPGASVTVSSTETTYVSSTSGTTIPSSGWQSSVPTVAQGSYLWTKVVTTFSDSSKATSYTASRQGSDGSNGTNGTSVTVSSTAYAYQLSTSGTTVPTGTWQTTPQAPTTTQYAWTRTTTTYSDGSSAITYTVGGKTGTNGTSYYTHIRYATDSSGTGMTASPSSSTKYIGLYSGTSSTAPTSAGSYTWSKYVGDQGPKGDTGDTGATGPEATVSVYPSAIDWSAGTATLAVTLRVNGTITTPSTYKWTKGTSTTSLGTQSTLAITDLNATYNCTVTW